jgi:hypothetical protein
MTATPVGATAPSRPVWVRDDKSHPAVRRRSVATRSQIASRRPWGLQLHPDPVGFATIRATPPCNAERPWQLERSTIPLLPPSPALFARFRHAKLVGATAPSRPNWVRDNTSHPAEKRRVGRSLCRTLKPSSLGIRPEPSSRHPWGLRLYPDPFGFATIRATPPCSAELAPESNQHLKYPLASAHWCGSDGGTRCLDLACTFHL